MKPYYEADGVALYLGDCREVLPSLSVEADLIVTDPPYGETSLEWDTWPHEWPAIARSHAKSMWCFGSMRMFLDRREDFVGWKLSQDIVWQKNRPSTVTTDRFARIHEHALHWYQGPWAEQHHDTPKVAHLGPRVATARRAAVGPQIRGELGASVWEDDGTRWQTTVIQGRNMHRTGAINETEKPVGILEPLIQYGCPPNGFVLDLFAGSASTLVAARNIGRRAVGIEARESQCEAAAKRLDQGVLDFGQVS